MDLQHVGLLFKASQTPEFIIADVDSGVIRWVNSD